MEGAPKSKIFVEKCGMRVESSLLSLLDKLQNGDFSELSDMSDYEGDDELVKAAESFKKKLNEEIDDQSHVQGTLDDHDLGDECEEINNSTKSAIDNIKISEKSKIKWTRKNVLIFNSEEWRPPTESSLDENDILNPIEYFLRYITPDIIDQFVEKTNIYAIQSGTTSFKPTNNKEIETFIGLHLLMGCLSFPRISMYWENALGLSVFRDAMQRNRFYNMRTNLHLVNNLERDPNNSDKFFKVRPIYDAIRNRCLQLNVEEKVCVDEQMCPFKGQLSSKQYMKGKPKPWGIKLFLLCGESGIVYDFVIYQGKSTEINQELQNKFGQGAAVVVHLSQRITIPYTELYFDNYFTTYGLLQYLKSKQILAAGTARMNRFANPTFLPDKQIMKKERGYMEQLYSEDQDIVMVKWYDNRIVNMASNFIGIGRKDTVKRWDKSSKNYVEVHRPEVIKKYNNSMGGVDKIDFLIGLYRVFIRSRKWTLRLIFHAIDIAICNSWLEYRNECTKANVEKRNILDLLNFKLEIANSLIKRGQTCIDRKRGRPSTSRESSPIVVTKRKNVEVRPSSDIRLDKVDHLPIHNGQKEAGRCKNPKCSGKSHFKCEKCNIHLCLSKQKNCFREFYVK